MNREFQQEREGRLTPEERQLRVKKLKRKRRFRVAVVTVGFFLALSIVISPILLFALFRVKTFTVEGTVPYSNDEIIAASGISIGKSLLFADLDEAAEAIEKNLPYTDNVVLTRKLPSGIVIRSESTSKAFAVELSGGMYALTDCNLKVLELSGFVPEGITLISGAVPMKSSTGEILSFVADSEEDDKKKSEDETEIKDKTLALLLEITGGITENKIKDIDYISITDTKNIYLIYQKRIVLELGDSSDMAAKLSLGGRVVNEENDIDPSKCGTIDLSIIKQATVARADFEDVPELVEYGKLYMENISEREEQENNAENSAEE